MPCSDCDQTCNCSICDLALQVPGAAPNRIVRFNSAGDCFEAVPLSILLDGIDTKVSVDSADVGCPGYLYDKIMSSDNSILINKIIVGPCKKVDLTFNTSVLQMSMLGLNDGPDIYPNCDVSCGYVTDAYVRTKSDGSGFYFDCQCCEKGYASMTLTTNVIIDQSTNQEKFYVFSGGVGTPTLVSAEPLIFSVRGIDHNRGLVIVNGSISFDACSAGIWRVSFDGHQEVNKGVHGTRVGLLLIRGGVAYYFTETRYSGLSDNAYVPTADVNGNFGDNTLTTAGGGNGSTWSMGRHFERLPVGKTRHISILPGDRLIPYAKLSTVLSGDADASSVDGQLSILGGMPGVLVAADSGLNISLEKLGKN